MMNILNGGKHADNTVDFQEFMVMPRRRADLRAKRCAKGAEIFHALKSVLQDRRARPASATRAASPPT